MKYCFNSYTKCGIFLLKKKRHKNVKVGHKNHYIFTRSATKRWISWLKAHRIQGKVLLVILLLLTFAFGWRSLGRDLWHPGATWALLSLDQGVLPLLHGPRAVAACGSCCSLTVSHCPWELPRPLQGEHPAKSLHEFASLQIPIHFLGNSGCKGTVTGTKPVPWHKLFCGCSWHLSQGF